jgi:hypothetical protein
MKTINFSVNTQYGTFTDAIMIDDSVTLSDSEIEAIKQQRIDNWIAVVSVSEESEYVHPLEPPPPIITEETTE